MKHSFTLAAAAAFLAVGASLTVAAGDKTLSPEEVRKLLDERLSKAATVTFVVASIESDGPDADMRLIPFDPPGWRPGRPPAITAVTLTSKVRKHFGRFGISDLEAHLRGKNVRVYAKVAGNWLADGTHYQEHLVVEDITHFEAVERYYPPFIK